MNLEEGWKHLIVEFPSNHEPFVSSFIGRTLDSGNEGPVLLLQPFG